MADTTRTNWPSYSVTRALRRQMQKFELSLASLGIRFTIQHERELSRLHTFLPGDRCELDYSKFGIFLRPNRAWKEKVGFQVGIGVDHASGVIKGFTVSAQPTAISGVRLYKNCVLPARLWLRPELAEKYGDKLDACGIDRVVVMDNALDLKSNHMVRMLMQLGVIMLLAPPKRGDLKGKVERTIRSLEQTAIEVMPGYYPNGYRFTDPRNKWLRDKAERSTSLTVAEFEDMLCAAIVAHNWQNHPDFKKPRMIVYREGLTSAPPLLPVGLTQIDSLFAMTYTSKVTREGVQAETWHYNSAELHDFVRVDGPSAKVCVPVDDVRTAVVFHEELVEPIRVPLMTHKFDGPTPLELAKTVVTASAADATRQAWDAEGKSAIDEMLNRMAELQRSGRRRKDVASHLSTTAASQAAHAPPVDPPRPRAASDQDLDKIFPDGGA